MTQMRIMVVEDEGITAQNIRQNLISLGYDVPDPVASGEEALEKAAAWQPALILMDIGLAGEMDGIAAAAEIRRRFDIPVIYLTAHTDEHTLQRAKITEPFGYLLKPFQAKELHSTVEMALYKHKMERALARELTINTALAELYAPLIAPDSSFKEIAETVLECAKHLTGSAHGYVSEIDPATGDNVAHAATAMMPDSARGAATQNQVIFQQGDDGNYRGLLGHALNTRLAFYTNDPTNYEVSSNPPAGHIPLRRFLSAPVLLGTELAGQIALANADHDYTDYDLRAMQRLAEFYALAIQRMRVEQKVYRRNRELTLLNQIIAAASTQATPESMLQLVCYELAQAFELPHVSATLINETEVAVVAEYRLVDQPTALGLSVSAHDNPAVRFLASLQEPLVINDVRQNPSLAEFQPQLEQEGIASIIILPLVIDQKTVGSLNLYLGEAQQRLSPDKINIAWNVAGEVAGVLARARLAEERERLEEQYRQAQKMEAVGQLAAGIAHDFNNLLTSINGFAELMQQRAKLDEAQQKYVKNILGSGRRAAELVQQLLAFSRKQVVKLQVLNLNEVVAEINEMLRRVIGEHIHLQTNLAPDLWPLEADPGQLEQVIVNLAVNARDAMPNGGRLTIETANIRLSEDDVAQHPETPPGDYVLLAVSDTGCGIAAELQEHIFEPFFTTKARGQGTGLGLATVYGIVKQSRGDIRLESPAIVSPQEGDERAGPGTTFKIYLPRAVKVDTRPLPAQSRVEAPPGHETVLLVEDDPAVRDLTRQVLEQHGYHLLEAQEAGEACRLAAQHPGPIHLLLTDVIMPDVNGKDLADRLVQARPNLKILFMSGYTDEMIDRHGVLNPGIAFIAKPFSPSVLAQTVRTVLDNHTFSEVV